MRKIGEIFAKNPDFVESFLQNIPKEKLPLSTDLLPSELCGRQVRMLLGGISDRTLNRYRKHYPEMISGGPRSRRYKKSAVLQLAKNKGITPAIGL